MIFLKAVYFIGSLFLYSQLTKGKTTVIVELEKKIRIYTPKAMVELVEDKIHPKSNKKGMKDFVLYLRYRNTIPGEYILRAKKLKKLKKHFKSHFQVVPAAGGVVINEKKEVLLIHRRGFWDLPKGKFEKGETKKQCALREVEEETGIKGLAITESLKLYYNGKKTTYHTYRYKNKPALKPSYWYMMEAPKQVLTPQTEEDIEQAIWVKIKDLPNYYEGAYPAIADILKSIS